MLTWKPQINSLCSKIHYSLHSLVCLKDVTPFHIRLHLAKSLLVPLFQYCDVIYSSCNVTLFRKVQVAFNSVIRYVQGLRKFEHISRYSKTLLNCTLPNYLKYRICCLVFKIMRDGPSYLSPLFVRGRSVRTRDLIMPRINSSIVENSFQSRGIQLWNALPPRCKAINSLSSFKCQTFQHFSSMD